MLLTVHIIYSLLTRYRESNTYYISKSRFCSATDDLRLSGVGFHLKIKYAASAGCPEKGAQTRGYDWCTGIDKKIFQKPKFRSLRASSNI